MGAALVPRSSVLLTSTTTQTATVAQRAAFSTSVSMQKTVTDSAKDALGAVDRAVSDKLVDGIDLGSNVASKIKEVKEEVIGSKSAEQLRSEAAGKASEMVGQAKGKASQVAGQAQGKASEMAGKAQGMGEQAKGQAKGKASEAAGKVEGAAEEVRKEL